MKAHIYPSDEAIQLLFLQYFQLLKFAAVVLVNKQGLNVIEASVKMSAEDDSDKDGWINLMIVVFALVCVALVAMFVLRRRQGRMTLPRSVHELVGLRSYETND